MLKFPSLNRFALTALLAFAMAACSGGDEGPGGRVEGLVDMTMGSPDAPVELIEYASTTCPACANFNATMKDTIKQLADEGKLYFIFREFPRDQIDVAAFATARCAGEDKYFDVVDDIFSNQQGIISAARNGSIRVALQAVGGRHGVDKAQFEACLEDVEIRSAIANAAEAGRQAGVSGTPSLFLNGADLDLNRAATPEALTELVEAGQTR